MKSVTEILSKYDPNKTYPKAGETQAGSIVTYVWPPNDLVKELTFETERLVGKSYMLGVGEGAEFAINWLPLPRIIKRWFYRRWLTK